MIAIRLLSAKFANPRFADGLSHLLLLSRRRRFGPYLPDILVLIYSQLVSLQRRIQLRTTPSGKGYHCQRLNYTYILHADNNQKGINSFTRPVQLTDMNI